MTYVPDYSVSYGSKYEKDLDVKEIAKRVRADIKKAVKEGDLPQLKASVRISRFSGGCSLNVELKDCAFQLYSDEYLRHSVETPKQYFDFERYSETALKVLKRVESMVSAYNYNGSDIMVDYFNVNFYDHVRFSWEQERDQRNEWVKAYNEEKAAARVTVDVSRPQASWNF